MHIIQHDGDGTPSDSRRLNTIPQHTETVFYWWSLCFIDDNYVLLMVIMFYWWSLCFIIIVLLTIIVFYYHYVLLIIIVFYWWSLCFIIIMFYWWSLCFIIIMLYYRVLLMIIMFYHHYVLLIIIVFYWSSLCFYWLSLCFIYDHYVLLIIIMFYSFIPLELILLPVPCMWMIWRWPTSQAKTGSSAHSNTVVLLVVQSASLVHTAIRLWYWWYSLFL